MTLCRFCYDRESVAVILGNHYCENCLWRSQRTCRGGCGEVMPPRPKGWFRCGKRECAAPVTKRRCAYCYGVKRVEEFNGAKCLECVNAESKQLPNSHPSS